MFTKQIYFLLLLTLTSNCFGQRDTTVAPKKFIFGTNIGVYLSAGSQAINYTPALTIKTKHTQFLLAPLIGPKWCVLYRENRPEPMPQPTFNLNGLNATFQVNPFPTRKVIDFFLEYNVGFQYIKYQEQNTILDYNYITYRYTTHQEYYNLYRTNLENCLGLGFKIKFLRNFYFNQSIGLGMQYTFYSVGYPDDYVKTEKYFSFDLIAKAGIGYTFERKN